MRFCDSSELHKVNRAIGTPDDFACIKSEIQSGRSRFVCIFGTYFVLRIDSDGLVVVCAQGQNIKQASHIIIELARRLHIRNIYFHTKRPALARLLKHCNFKYLETDPNGCRVFGMVVHEHKF
ncbi:hypothetical protein AN213_00445 [Pseudoalteromonas sp. P1-8]|nr:hypothetical protein AN213_00445 [Pseudoalteromonas sp. P1-8]